MDNYKLSRVDSPSSKIAKGDLSGKYRVAYDEIDLASIGSAIGLGDVLLGPVLPPGARVHEVVLEGPNAGANGSLEAGWLVVEDFKSNVLEAADSDGFMAAQDFTGAAAVKKMSDTAGVAGHMKRFPEQKLSVALTATVAFAAQVGIVKVAVHYTIS